MSPNPNKISQFWQEVKRRNVFRVVTVYTGAAFVILSLVDMIREPFELPNWSFKLVVVVLSIGLIIAVILSWIYDIHPEEGIVKTEPVQKVKPDDIPKSSNGWKIASYISFMVIVGMIVYYVIPREGKKEVFDKSIAVMPFINESPELENGYIISGYRTAVHNNLCQIMELRVLSLESAEQYKDQAKSPAEIAKELGVGYLLSARGQILNNKIRLTVQLEDANGEMIWSNPYDRQIRLVEDHTDIQSDIAQLVARKLEATITPAEKQLMDKAPTTSMPAYELYQMGREEYIKFLLNIRDRDALTRAQGFYLKALEYDSTYAKACAGVAMTFYSKLVVRGKLDLIYFDGYLEDNAFNTVLFWANKALHFDRQLPEAYFIRGNYYLETGNREKAEQDYQHAIQLNPNYWEAYYGLGNMYTFINSIKVFQYFQKAATLVRGPEQSYILSSIIQTYAFSGNLELAKPLLEDNFNLTQDSLVYYVYNYWADLLDGNLENSHHWITRAYAYDSTNPIIIGNLAESYVTMGNFKKGLEYYKRSEDINRRLERILVKSLHRIGYAYSKAGYKGEADDYFDRAEEFFKNMIRLHRPLAQCGNSQYDLAALYAFRGEKSKAMEILRDLHQRSPTPFVAALYMQRDPLLNPIRDDPEFQQIDNDLSLRLDAQMNRVRLWLEENEML